MEARIGFEPMDKGFADLCLTTWLPRRKTKPPHYGGGKVTCVKLYFFVLALAFAATFTASAFRRI